MSLDATKVRVALTGNIWYASDLDITIPSGFSNSAMTGFTNLGYTTEEGVEFSFSKETQDIKGWQTADTLRKLVTDEPKTASFTLRQMERATWLASMGGSITSTGTAPNEVYRWEPTTGQVPEGVVLIDFTDGALSYRFGFRRASQTAEVQFSLVRDDSIQLPNEWTALATKTGQSSFYMDTNDPAFADAA